MNLEFLQQGLNQMKQVVESAITEREYTNENGEQIEYTTGSGALSGLQKGQHHIMPIHEAVKRSVNEILNGDVENYHVFPPIGERSPELVVPGWLPKAQDVVFTFEDLDQYENNILTTADARRSIVISIRSQLTSVLKNKNTIMERTVAEPFLTRFETGNEIIIGEFFVLPVQEYYTSGANGTVVNTRSFNTNRTNWIEWYISNFIKITNRTDINDWRQHIRYERACIVMVRMEGDVPRFYRTLQEMHADGFVSEEFYNANHEAYDQHLSPLNFARDLVAAHRERWLEIYPDDN